jgi:hypothetical protein
MIYCEIFSMIDQQKKFFYGNISNLVDCQLK